MKPTTELSKPDTGDTIELSKYTKALTETLELIRPSVVAADAPKISVSQTVSFFSILYEKARNAIEFREEHLVRRAAIERILNRRLSMNPEGDSEGQNLIRELLWARYLPNESVTDNAVGHFQTIIDKYISLVRSVRRNPTKTKQSIVAKYLMDFLSCEIEEELNPDISQARAAYLHYFYQVLHNKVEIESESRENADAYFYVAAERAYAKNDNAYIRYHLFQLMNKKVGSMTQKELDMLARELPDIVARIDKVMKNKFDEKLTRFAKRHVPPFLILRSLMEQYRSKVPALISSKQQLFAVVESVCGKKYMEAGGKLRKAAIRSIIYIFLTKTLFALFMEMPLSKILYGEVNFIPLGINTLFPPIFMGFIVLFVTVPGERNTKAIFERIVDILNKDPSFEQTVAKFTTSNKVRRPLLIFGFTLVYLATFWVTFSLIYYVLGLLGFNPISIGVFIFFVSLVAFFGYRIRQTTREYTLDERPGIFSPIVDFFFIPILYMGKFLSREVARLNVLILIFDFLIEAPFKLISEIVEEWINFIRARKEEII